MKRRELYESIIMSILSLFPEIPDKDVFTAAIGAEDLSIIIDDLLVGLPHNLENLTSLLNGLKNFLIDVDEEISDYSNLKVQWGPYKKLSNEREFVINENDLALIDSKKLYIGTYDETVLSIVLKICYDIDNRNNFLSFITNPGPERTFHIIFDKNIFDDTIFNLWDIYHYALLRYLNDGNIIKRELSLDFSPYQIYNHLNFDTDVQYNQFIDIYDVLSEFNHAQDILAAFVKMYQLLEYIIYRKELVKIIEGSSIKQSFVRQIKGIDRKYLNSERDAFCSHLFKVIDSFNGEITNVDITQDMIDFCGKYYEKTNSGISYINATICNDENVLNKSIAKFIYDTRCAIVHNKEAEFHITYFNYNEYAAIIPLMEIVIRGITKRIVKLLNTPNSHITFPKDHLELY